MVSKTREKLIEVARQLFAYKGVENTTMNDIAAASDKGRRTIYTYFKNKREIYNAVIEQQSNAVIGKLSEIVDKELPADEKLRMYIDKRLEIIKEWPKPKHSRYSSLFNRDIRRMERINRMALSKERALFSQIMRQGVEEGIFDEKQAAHLPVVIGAIYTSSDYCALHNNFELYDTTEEAMRNDIIEFVVNGLKPTK